MYLWKTIIIIFTWMLFKTKSIFHINWAIVYTLLTGLHYGAYKAWVVRHLTPLTQRLRLLTGCSIVGLAASAPSGGSTKLYLEYWTQTLFALYRCNKALALCIAEEQQAQCVWVVHRYVSCTHPSFYILKQTKLIYCSNCKRIICNNTEKRQNI